MNKSIFLKFFSAILIVMMGLATLSVIPVHAAACTFTSNATGNWDTAGTWTAVGTSCSTYPGETFAGDIVVIRNGNNVTLNVTPANSIASLQLGGTTGGSGNGTLTFNAGTQITVTGAVTIGNGGRQGSINMTLGGILSADNLIVNNSAGTWTPGAGTVQLNATNTLPTNFFTTFNNLTINNGTTTLGAGVTVSNIVTIISGATLDISTLTMTLSGGGTINVNGTLDFSNSTGLIRSGTSGTSTLTMGANGTIRTSDASGLGPAANASLQTQTGGAWNLSNVSTVGTVEYYRNNTSGQTVTDRNYNNLTITGSTQTKTWTLATTHTVNGNLTINSGAPLTLAGSQIVNINGNWSNSGTFTAGTSTVGFTGSAVQTIGGSSATNFNNLTINNGNGVSLSGVNITVNGTLTFTNGKITTGSNYVILPTTATATGNVNSYVNGNVRRAFTNVSPTFTFPVGDATNFAPIQLSFASVSVNGNVDASVTNAACSSPGIDQTKNVNHCWTLTNGGVTFTNYSTTLNFQGVGTDADAGSNTAAYIVGRNDGSWTYPTIGTKTATSTQATGITALGTSSFEVGEVVNLAPNAPSSINQYKTDATTVITQGAFTNQTQVAFKATATDPESNQYQLQVEVQPNANAFTNTATCTSPLTNSGTETSTGACGTFVDGTDYKWQYRLVDSLGAATTWTSFGGSDPDFRVDTTTPDTNITSNPPHPSNSSSASFQFNGTDPSGSGVASFQCQLDGGGFSACTSPQSYTGLSDGSHTFQVRSIDVAGNIDSTPASYTWVVDTISPTAPVVITPTNGGVINDSTPSVTGFAEVNSTVTVYIDGSSVGSTTSDASGNWSFTILSILSDGSHTVKATSTDAAGNTSPDSNTNTFTVDTTAPDTTINSNPSDPSNDATPTFTFSSPDLTATFECSIDGGVFSACTSPDTLAALGDSSHIFAVRAVDIAGNVDATPASYTWTIDTAAPDTTIDSNPSDPSNDATPTFTFSSPDLTATFECSIDGGAFSACSSPNTLATLGDGSHTFDVRAVDAAGNMDATPASYTWVIDATAPDTTIDSNPSDPSNDTTPTFTFSSPDLTATFECSIDGSAFTACTSPNTLAALGDGSHAFDVRAIDAVGNEDASPASYTWVIDATAPDTTIDSNPTNPSNDSTPTFTFSSPDLTATFECSIDGGAFSACTSPDTLATLGDGSHTYTVRAADAAGNMDATPASYTWVIDATAPDTTIDNNPTDPSNDATPTFTFSSPDLTATFECSIDSGAFSTCASPNTLGTLGDGSHTFDVRAVDPLGNTDTSPASYTWTIDTTAPDTTIDNNPSDPSNDAAPTFTFSSPDLTATFECSIDGGAFSACTSPDTLGALGDGSHTFDVRAVDPLGNTDASPASYTWTIDTAAPDTTIDSNPTDPSNDATPTFTFSSPDLTATFECSIDGSAFSACTSPDTLTALGDGSHTFDVRAADAAGNMDPTPAFYTWVIDATDPDTTIDSNPTNPSNDATPTFTFSSPDLTVTFECSIDSGAFTACTSPNTLAALGDGSHTFDVRAVDPLGNTDASPASYTWTINTSAPVVTNVTSPDADGTYFVGDTITVEITFDDTVNLDLPACTPQLTLELGTVDGVANYSGGTGTTTLTFTYTVVTGNVTPDLDYVDANSLSLNDCVSIQDPALNNASLTLPTPGNAGSLGANKAIMIDAGLLMVTGNGINSVPDTGDAQISENENVSMSLGITELIVTFNKDVYDDPTDAVNFADDATNPANYLLVYSSTGTFNTLSCASGLVAPDIPISVASVAYSNGGGSGPFVATVTMSTPLTIVGYYRLFVCGTTSIVQANNNTLALAGNGVANNTDFIRNFRIGRGGGVAGGGGGGGGAGNRNTQALTVAALPATGFAPNRVTILPEQPAELAYSNLGDLWIEIPSLGVKSSIVGVPMLEEGEWDVTWLGNSVGWLNGTAFPSWEGNSVLTAHVTNASGLDGPFANLKKLKYGDQIIIHAFGQKYIFEIRNTRVTKPFSTSYAFEHLEDQSYLTLITCQVYLPKSDTYLYRRVVRAVLVKIETE